MGKELASIRRQLGIGKVLYHQFVGGSSPNQISEIFLVDKADHELGLVRLFAVGVSGEKTLVPRHGPFHVSTLLSEHSQCLQSAGSALVLRVTLDKCSEEIEGLGQSCCVGKRRLRGN